MKFLSYYYTYVLEQKTTPKKEYAHYVVDPTSKEVIIRNDTMGKYAKPLSTLNDTLDEMGIKNNIEFAMNCALYEPGGKNTGAYNFKGKKITGVESGKQDVNFALHDFPGVGRNGVLYTSGSKTAWNIVPTNQWNDQGYYAIQNGPILIWDGQINPVFKVDSKNTQSYRNGIGLDKSGKLHFILALNDTTFYELSKYMLDQGCIKAIFCDANVSQVYMNGSIQGSSSSDVGPIIIVNKSSETTQSPPKNNQMTGGNTDNPNTPATNNPTTTAPPTKRKPSYDPNLRSKYKF
jgi:uncharacterized protein YigE (DUF2233 family)